MLLKGLIKGLRIGLGSIIVFGDWATRPKPTLRSPEDQEKAQNAVNGLSLYQLYACPFCVKTRRAIHKLNVSLNLNDISKNQDHRTDLESGGGRIKVPCLKVEENNEVRWIYESNDIISFIEQRVATR
ncbi:MAG TPA: glutaredoxin [Gammaproteobacteria bacterium]|nr:glutaredoxin [Gammaproteobacteria bacterium]